MVRSYLGHFHIIASDASTAKCSSTRFCRLFFSLFSCSDELLRFKQFISSVYFIFLCPQELQESCFDLSIIINLVQLGFLCLVKSSWMAFKYCNSVWRGIDDNGKWRNFHLCWKGVGKHCRELSYLMYILLCIGYPTLLKKFFDVLGMIVFIRWPLFYPHNCHQFLQ